MESSVFELDLQGNLVEVLSDPLGLGRFQGDGNFASLVSRDESVKFWRFLLEVLAQGVVLQRDVEMVLPQEGEVRLFLSGMRAGDRIVLAVSRGDGELDLMEELGRVNNEQANAQRELAKKNRQLEELNQRLQEMAIRDHLTGLYNRRYLSEVFPREVARSRRYGTRLTLVSMDLDGFKQVNDSLGHLEGDRVLAEFARLLEGCTRRQVDYPFRVGGDEFLLILVGVGEEEEEGVMARLEEQVRRELPVVGLSHGVVQVDVSSPDLDGVLMEADRRMYRAKRAKGLGRLPSRPGAQGDL
ncbi:GGDEF domain-containing protein [Thermanaerovibrio acidaminovorans]|uniref:GGDEF domain-containing protein n=1 Tax=Thermanaerovibrio acidaminovorans TaxID=81462 RepID=UPI002491C962|nr:GGDEF domain-containing protein [Thermanaerovibrio acidaminovorans]